MPKLLRTQLEVETASMEDLIYTHNELKGDNLKEFPTIGVAKVRVRMDILAAENEAGKAGVARHEKPKAKTVAELGYNPYPEGTLSHQLHEEVVHQKPITPRPKKAELPPEEQRARVAINTVRATFKGTSRLQAGSTRAQVLKFIQESPNHTSTVEAIEKQFNQPARGFLQKLLEKNHIELVEDAQ